jgi:GTP-binding protein
MGERPFLVVDTGGFEPTARDGIMVEMAQQAEQAIAEADVLIFLVDGRAGLTAHDQEIAARLRRVGKPLVLAINKRRACGRRSSPRSFTNWALANRM